MLDAIIKKFVSTEKLKPWRVVKREMEIEANIVALTDFLFDWVPLREWEPTLERVTSGDVHTTMQVAAKRLLKRFGNPKALRKRPWIRV
jgi:hypothetical protein